MRVSRTDTELGQEFPWADEIRTGIERWQPTDEGLPRHWLRVVARQPIRPGRRRLRYVVAVAAFVATGLLVTASTTGAGPHWWVGFQSAVQNAMRQIGGSSSGSGTLPKGGVPLGNVNTAAPASSPPPAVPSPAPTSAPNPTADSHGPKGGSSVVGVTVSSGPNAGPPNQGVAVGDAPQGGMTGSAGLGPIHTGGTIDDGGIRGCFGVYDQQAGQWICGSANLPVSLPLPNLPAPVIPDVTQPEAPSPPPSTP